MPDGLGDGFAAGFGPGWVLPPGFDPNQPWWKLPQPQGQLEPGNINLLQRPTVPTPDGGYATVRSMSRNIDGQEVLMPTVSADGRLLTPDEATAEYYRTGKHLGKFDTPENATAAGQTIHEQQQQHYAPPSAPAPPDPQTLQRLMGRPDHAQTIADNLADTIAPTPREKAVIYNALTSGANWLLDKVTPFVPPELRGKVGAAAQAIDMANPATALRNFTMDASQGHYGDAALNAFSLIPGEGIAAVTAKAIPAMAAMGKLAKRGGPVEEFVRPQSGELADQLRAASYENKRYAPLGAPESADVNAPPNRRIQTVTEPQRMAFPGIYGDPRAIAERAAQQLAPEDPALKQLFGVTRGDLTEMARGRVGTEDPKGFLGAAKPKGSEAVDKIMTPRNVQRIQDILYEGGKIPGLAHTDAWYIMDPMYQRMVQLVGPDEAKLAYSRLNRMTSMASPSSDVLTEIQRGTAAHWLDKQGRFEDFKKYGGIAEDARGRNFPEDMRYIGGHAYHGTAMVPAMEQYLQTGQHTSKKPKVVYYGHASEVPETGFQTSAPVGDAHFVRGIGLADTRNPIIQWKASLTPSEFPAVGPWWRDQVAGPMGLQSVPAQARIWNILGPQTGVESPLGAGKLELFSQQIMKAAKRLGISPEKARDLILTGGAGAGVTAAAAPSLGDIISQYMQEQQGRQ